MSTNADWFLCSIFKDSLKERMSFSALNDTDKTTTELTADWDTLSVLYIDLAVEWELD